jgi:hypothetical protein
MCGCLVTNTLPVPPMALCSRSRSSWPSLLLTPVMWVVCRSMNDIGDKCEQKSHERVTFRGAGCWRSAPRDQYGWAGADWRGSQEWGWYGHGDSSFPSRIAPRTRRNDRWRRCLVSQSDIRACREFRVWRVAEAGLVCIEPHINQLGIVNARPSRTVHRLNAVDA